MSSRLKVAPRSREKLDFVDGDLVLGNQAIVEAIGTSSLVKVSGTVYCEGQNTIEGSLVAERLVAEDDVTVRGDLSVADEARVEEGYLRVQGKMTAKRVDIDASLYVESDLKAERIGVCGSLKVNGKVEGESVDCCGSFDAKGEVRVSKVDVAEVL
jgi:cytoskeletal protein CcmA (bactofilin family)